MSQAALAEATGIHASSLSFMVSGTRGVPPQKLPAIADALGVSVDYLTGRQAVEEAFAAISGRPGAVRGEDVPPDQWPPGLAEYLEKHPADPRLTPRLLYYLKNMRMRLEPWVQPGETFWNDCIDFWARYLAKLDKGQR